MRIFCPAIASLRPSLRLLCAALRPPRSGVSRVAYTRDHSTSCLGWCRGQIFDLTFSVVSGPAQCHENRDGFVTPQNAPAASPEQPGYCARDRRLNANRGTHGGGRSSRAAGMTGLRISLEDLGDPAGADGAATFADRELQTLLHGDRLDQLDRHVGVVARHDHLGALGQRDDTSHVRRTEVELGPVVLEERRVPAALLLGQDVDRRLEVRVRGRGARLDDDHAALDVLALGTTKQQTDVLTGLALVEQLAEHLDARDRGGLLLRTDADDVDGLVDLDDTALDPAGDDRATTRD